MRYAMKGHGSLSNCLVAVRTGRGRGVQRWLANEKLVKHHFDGCAVGPRRRVRTANA